MRVADTETSSNAAGPFAVPSLLHSSATSFLSLAFDIRKEYILFSLHLTRDMQSANAFYCHKSASASLVVASQQHNLQEIRPIFLCTWKSAGSQGKISTLQETYVFSARDPLNNPREVHPALFALGQWQTVSEGGFLPRFSSVLVSEPLQSVQRASCALFAHSQCQAVSEGPFLL